MPDVISCLLISRVWSGTGERSRSDVSPLASSVDVCGSLDMSPEKMAPLSLTPGVGIRATHKCLFSSSLYHEIAEFAIHWRKRRKYLGSLNEHVSQCDAVVEGNCSCLADLHSFVTVKQ